MPKRRNPSLEAEGAGVSLGGQGKTVWYALLRATSVDIRVGGYNSLNET